MNDAARMTALFSVDVTCSQRSTYHLTLNRLMILLLLRKALKAFICGIFMKLGPGVKRKREQMKQTTSKIRVLELQNKSQPSSVLGFKLTCHKYELRLILLVYFEKTIWRLKNVLLCHRD